jgi:hypothetical protein
VCGWRYDTTAGHALDVQALGFAELSRSASYQASKIACLFRLDGKKIFRRFQSWHRAIGIPVLIFFTDTHGIVKAV